MLVDGVTNSATAGIQLHPDTTRLRALATLQSQAAFNTQLKPWRQGAEAQFRGFKICLSLWHTPESVQCAYPYSQGIKPINDSANEHTPRADRDHVVVAGAGIVGIACALELTRRGHRVTLIDRNEPAAGCSYGNAGMLWCPWITPIARPGMIKRVPGMLINPNGPLRISRRGILNTARWMNRARRETTSTRVDAIGNALTALIERAMPAHERAIKLSSAQHLVRRNGWLEVYRNTDSFSRDQPERDRQRLAGFDVEELDHSELQHRIPALSKEFVHATFHAGVCNTTDPKEFALTLFRQFLGNGGEFRQHTIHDIVFNVEGKPVVVNDDTPVHADYAVVAMGAWSNRLVRHIDGPVPLAAERGYHAMLPEPNIELPMPIVFKAEGFVATPMDAGMRIAGTDEFAPASAPANPRTAPRIAEQARHFLPGLNTADAAHWMGARPTLPDSLPVISRSVSHDRIIYAFGHHHLGLVLGPLTGELVSDIVERRDIDLDMAAYRVERLWSV